ncbi:unnamed protein product [Gongylonema pulchrum]|uniref:Uncharacterized protein n=1 Tax=Gongylonema pulchrum TaxID=637853 RepID=A0A183EQF5_9BILA|nr:unnamed protein product [Gongylonema pulchrum]
MDLDAALEKGSDGEGEEQQDSEVYPGRVLKLVPLISSHIFYLETRVLLGHRLLLIFCTDRMQRTGAAELVATLDPGVTA